MNAFPALIFILLCTLLSSCGECPHQVERQVLKGYDRIYLFNNENGNTFFEFDNTSSCAVDNLGISVKYVDSIVSTENVDGGSCYSKKLMIKRELLNVPRQLHIYSTSKFVEKNAGEPLNDFFLIGRDRTSFPKTITAESLAEFGESNFVLLTKPSLSLETQSTQNFVIEIKTDKEVFRDTTISVILQ